MIQTQSHKSEEIELLDQKKAFRTIDNERETEMMRYLEIGLAIGGKKKDRNSKSQSD